MAATLVTSTWLWDTAQASQDIKEARNILFGVGSGLFVAMLVFIVDVVFKNHWPSQEERSLCADLWLQKRRRQIRTALSERNPAHALAVVYAGDPKLAEFGSAEIYRAISNMHEGAFLAAIHLWGEDTYNEDVMPPNPVACKMDVQKSIWKYRKMVAEKIKGAHNIAARRYRVNARDCDSFIGDAGDPHRCFRLISLAGLASSVDQDLKQGWIVDVEFYQGSERHNPYLDYALLFGAQTTQNADVMDALPRVAYITHARDRLLSKKDYAGIVVSDPEVVMCLMEDRFRAEPGVQDGQDFLADVIAYLNNACKSVATNGVTNSETHAQNLARIRRLLGTLSANSSHQERGIAPETLSISAAPDSTIPKPSNQTQQQTPQTAIKSPNAVYTQEVNSPQSPEGITSDETEKHEAH